jgi:hypothetical protein
MVESFLLRFARPSHTVRVSPSRFLGSPMQPFDVCCPECTSTLRVSIAELVGRRVRCPQCRKPFLVVEPTPEQIGSGVLIGAGSGMNAFESNLDWQAPPPEASVLEEETPVDTDDVLSGGEPAYEEPANEEPVDYSPEELSAVEEVQESETAEVQYAEDAEDSDEEASNEDADEDSVSVESDYSSEPARSSGYGRPRGAGVDQQQMLMLGGAIGAGLLLCVTAFFLLGGSGDKSRGGRSRTGKVERRDPRAFQDFARQAERQGW